MTTRITMIIFTLIIIVGAGCMIPRTEEGPEISRYGAIVAAMNDLNADAEKKCPDFYSENPKRKSTEFDPNRYFAVLKHLSPPDGQTLDYVYMSSHLEGHPQLYFRRVSDPPFKTHAEYEKAMTSLGASRQDERKLPSLLRLDGTPESFFELAVFSTLAGKFCLFWHAGYLHKQIITSRKQIEDYAKRPYLSDEQKEQVRKLDVTPIVKFLDQSTAEVSLVQESWETFDRATWKIARSYPHTFTKDVRLLALYSRGIAF